LERTNHPRFVGKPEVIQKRVIESLAGLVPRRRPLFSD
jgi:hypothetical protein